MNRAWKHLAGNIFNGADPETVSAEELELLLEEYPYFAGLHLLKAAKLADHGSPEALAAKSRAALYFTNPHWFQALLSSPGEPKQVELPEVHDDVKEPDTAAVMQDHPEVSGNVVTEMQEAETDFDNRRMEPEPQWESALAENPVFQYQQPSDEEAYEQQQWHNHEAAENIPAEETTPEPVTEIQTQETVAEVDTSLEDIGDTAFPEAVEPEAEHLTPTLEIAETVELHEAQPPAEDQVPAVVAEGPADVEQLKDELSVEIPFEPLYTIDYFASQGIKYANEADKDQLSIKLKSFTEWLKSMKRLHPEKVQHSMDNDQEAVVRENAESSNEKQPILTEAMAEVYLKQGSREKAVEIYEKLSLLDPSKSAYFAVRIKEIKEN
jgi:hypothetical protein